MLATLFLLLGNLLTIGATVPIVNLSDINKELGFLNAATAELAWQSATKSSETANKYNKKMNRFRALWKNQTCLKLMKFIPFNSLDERSIELLCRGTLYTPGEILILSEVQSTLGLIYQYSGVCDKDKCYRMEPDLVNLMKNIRNPVELSEIWKAWRDSVGPTSKNFYTKLVQILNKGAQRNGYRDIGDIWREELEIDNIEMKMIEILEKVKPLYDSLHAVVRHRLREFYGPDHVVEHDAIPGHLLGNMWGQDWSKILDIVYKGKKTLTFTEEQKKHYSVEDLVKMADSFYKSIGFESVPLEFWKNSKFQNTNGLCHGTAVNMFKENDFRVILCANVTEEDLRIIFHELGHIKFFMEYQYLKAVFKEGNSAIQETIGDAVYLASYTARQRKRLGVESSNIFDDDIQYLLEMGLTLIPQLPFSYIMDKWRWSVFNGEITPKNYNSAWWGLKKKYQGIIPPVKRSEHDFDPAAKYHISDNTPYARYFFATILQVQFFEAMCKGAIFGDSHSKDPLPVPLNECDIHGSANSTKTLRKMMSLGSIVNFETAVKMVTNTTFSVQPFLNYFQPLKEWLEKEISTYNIPVGWE